MKTVLPQCQIWVIYVIFQALSTDNLKNKEKGVQQGQKFKIWGNLAFFRWICLYSHIFITKESLPQRQILTIYVIFQALSIDNLKNKEKAVQQGQKREIQAK